MLIEKSLVITLLVEQKMICWYFPISPCRIGLTQKNIDYQQISADRKRLKLLGAVKKEQG